MSDYPKCATLKVKAVCSQNHVVKHKYHRLLSSTILNHSLTEAVKEMSLKIK